MERKALSRALEKEKVRKFLRRSQQEA